MYFLRWVLKDDLTIWTSQLTGANVVRSCYQQLYHIGRIRCYIDENTASILARSLILSKLDFCNSLLIGLPDTLVKKLQRVQNNAARLVFRKKKCENVTPLLIKLHWLPVKQRIIYKLNVLTHKALNKLAPVYLQDLIIQYAPSRSLRSSSQFLLQEPGSKLKSYGDRAYSVCGPRLWNKLPRSLREPQSIEMFKSFLKTHLFKEAYNPW